MKKRQVAGFCRQMGLLLSAGIPLLSALELVQQGSKIKTAIKMVSQGEPLSAALAGFMPPLVIGSLQAAEANGQLEDNLALLARYYEERAELEQRLFQAMIYPLFVLAVSVFSLIFFAIFILPSFRSLLLDLGAEVPLFFKIIDELILALPLALVAALAVIVIVGRRKGREKLERLMMQLPFFGRVCFLGMIDYNFTLIASLLKGGVPILRTLEICSVSTTSQIFKKDIDRVRESITNGDSLSGALRQGGVVKEREILMVEIGERSGRLAETLSAAAAFCSQEREELLKKSVALAEPLLTLGVGAVVAVIVMTVFTPLVQVMNSI